MKQYLKKRKKVKNKNSYKYIWLTKTCTMKNINIEIWFRIAVIVLLLLTTARTCNTQRRVDRVVLPEIEAIKSTVNEVNTVTITADEFELMLEFVGYDISYRMLYDNNTVIRTTKRPDDIMNDYVQKKRELKRKLLRLRQGVIENEE